MDVDSLHFAAYIGLDWADTKHDYCLQEAGSTKQEYGQIKHSPESIEDWALSLQKRFDNQPVAICLELKAGPVVHALLKYAFIVLFPVAPNSLAHYRKVFTQSGAKDDPTDAYLQLDYLLRHRDALKPLVPDRPETRILQRLVEDRRMLVEDKVRLTNRLTASLKAYYPQALDWFADLDTELFCAFICRWSTLQQAKRAKRAQLEAFFKQHNCVRDDVIQRRHEAIQTALPLTADEGVIIPNERLVIALVSQLREVLKTIQGYDQEIARRFRRHADFELFNSFPGAGPAMAPRLLAAFGSNRTRFDSAEEVSRQVGVAPVLERSGKRTWVHWRYSCPKFLRQTFVEWAGLTIRYSYWAREFYDAQRAKGKPHNVTIRALAFKWIRILFRCWKDRQPYDEATYLFALKRRRGELPAG